VKIWENWSSGSRVAPRRQMDRETNRHDKT